MAYGGGAWPIPLIAMALRILVKNAAIDSIYFYNDN
jgi:hypothetical protein